MAGMVILVFTTPLFWLCILLVPFTSLIPDIALKAISITAFTSETDKIRIAEVSKKDPGDYISDSKRESRDASLRNTTVNRGKSDIAGVDEMEMTRGYAFSQEEGGAISQTEYIRRYDTTSATHRSKRHLSGGT